MNDFKIFAREKQDGLESLLNNNFISFASQITSMDVQPEQDLIVQEKASNIFKGMAKSIEQPDLVRKYSILASVAWNGNDDVFTGPNLFAARHTPVDKQVNFMHDELKIIGHMTESFILDENRNLLKANSIEELPEKFDIGVAFVLYKLWDDDERNQLMQRVISEMDSGNWFVSMECRFPSFDYAVIDKDGNQKVIARDENTSYLTKHLRAYGGSGKYQDYKIGRLLKGLFFSGKGIVDNPANKRSLILNDNIVFSSKSNLKIREVKMEEDYKKVVAELATVRDEFKKLAQETAQKAQAAVTEQINELKAQATKLEEAAKAEKAVLANKLAETTANLDKVIIEAKAAKDEKDKIASEMEETKCAMAKAARIAQLRNVGLDEAKATEIYAKFSSLADAQFAEIVPLYKTTKAMDDDDDEKAAALLLEQAKKEKSTANTTSTTDVATQTRISGLASRMTNFMPKALAAQTQTK